MERTVWLGVGVIGGFQDGFLRICTAVVEIGTLILQAKAKPMQGFAPLKL